MWQSLSFGANYKAAYCLAVCPAGDDVIGPFLNDRKTFLKDTLRPLTEKEETVYVIAGSDAEEYAPRRFPMKKVKRVASGFRAVSIEGFLAGLRLLFQPGKAEGLDAVYHFTFTGQEPKESTVIIRGGAVEVKNGHEGEADLRGDRRQRDMAGVPGERAELALGLAAPAHPHSGTAAAARRLRQVLPLLRRAPTPGGRTKRRRWGDRTPHRPAP